MINNEINNEQKLLQDKINALQEKNLYNRLILEEIRKLNEVLITESEMARTLTAEIRRLNQKLLERNRAVVKVTQEIRRLTTPMRA